MKRLERELGQKTVDSLSPTALLDQLDRLGKRLSTCDLTFAIVAGVSQGFSMLQRLLERRVGDQWRPLLNDALQGTGTVISARQILWLTELADVARQNPTVVAFFIADPWRPDQSRTRLAGSHFLQRFDEYLHEYGHRAVGESDVMSPRFSETPDYVLSVIRRHVIAPSPMSAQKIRAKQLREREQALGRIRSAFGGRYHEWRVAHVWLARLGRFLALRETNRHHLMYCTAAVRRVLLALGQNVVERHIFNERNDIFFLTPDEITRLSLEESTDWKAVIGTRRGERESEAARVAPDFIQSKTLRRAWLDETPSTRVLKGLSVSTGLASGPVRLVRSTDDYPKVQRGDIVVTSVIDPGMAPFFGLASGIVAEMGGILSHGAIIAREYGLPAVVNVRNVTKVVADGQMLLLNATAGDLTFQETAPALADT
jgi:pyruvate,water dikinase